MSIIANRLSEYEVKYVFNMLKEISQAMRTEIFDVCVKPMECVPVAI